MENTDYEKASIISDLIERVGNYPSLRLFDAVELQRSYRSQKSFHVCQNVLELERYWNSYLDNLKDLGLEGDNSYLKVNPNMTLRDYLLLVPEELLPNGYMY